MWKRVKVSDEIIIKFAECFNTKVMSNTLFYVNNIDLLVKVPGKTWMDAWWHTLKKKHKLKKKVTGNAFCFIAKVKFLDAK